MVKNSSDGEVVSLAYRRWLRDDFDALFKGGKELVEATAAYLDGPGRQESSQLLTRQKMQYRTESLRLTTLLMQLISWLLAQRAVKEFEMTQELFERGRQRIKLTFLVRLDIEKMLELPESFFVLAQRANNLLEEILKADAQFSRKGDAERTQQANG